MSNKWLLALQEVYVEFFIWALLTNKQGLVDFFWTRCSQPLLMAIIAAAISSRYGASQQLEDLFIMKEPYLAPWPSDFYSYFVELAS